jgi:signal recognition particle subunit SRP72
MDFSSFSSLRELAFEKAYALYRLSKPSEALDALSLAAKQNEPRIMELQVQILYRLERYEECQQLYKKLIRDSADDYGDERSANLAAVQAQLVIEGKAKDMGPESNFETYEQKYNFGCGLLARGMLTEAERCFKGENWRCCGRRLSMSRQSFSSVRELGDNFQPRFVYQK